MATMVTRGWKCWLKKENIEVKDMIGFVSEQGGFHMVEFRLDRPSLPGTYNSFFVLIDENLEDYDYGDIENSVQLFVHSSCDVHAMIEHMLKCASCRFQTRTPGIFDVDDWGRTRFFAEKTFVEIASPSCNDHFTVFEWADPTTGIGYAWGIGPGWYDLEIGGSFLKKMSDFLPRNPQTLMNVAKTATR